MNNDYPISKTINTDVLVVRAGDSGMMAAAAATEAGAKVTVVEKENKIGLLRLSNAAVGSNAQKRAGVTIDKLDLVEYLASFAHHNVDQKLLRVWANNSAEAVNWLENNILKPNGAYMRAEPDAMVTSKNYRGFPTENDPTVDGKSYVSYGNWFVKWAKDHEIKINYRTSLVKLIKEANTVTGAIVHDLEKDEYYQINASKGVILCTGGYSANKELLKKWNPEALKKNVYNDSPRNDGAGISAALEIGALRDQEPAECIFDRGLVKPGTTTDEMYYPTETFENWLWIGSYPFLKVNLRGQRFANESVPYQFISNAASKEPGYLYAMIWDADYPELLKQFHMLGCAKFGFPGYMKDKQAFVDDVNKYIEKGLIIKADTIEELAAKLHLPVENLMKKKILLITLMAAGLALAGCSRQIKKASRPSTKTSQSSKKKASQPDKITQIMNKMTLDEKIGQLYFAHSTGNFDQMKADISKYHLGGTTLFGPDFKDRSKTQFKQEMQTYQSNSSYGLLIATDQEGGTVSRINTNSKISTRKYPSPQEIYQARGLKGIKQEDSNVARILRENGINMNFAPVADVARDRQSFIYDRTLGQNYEITAKYIPIAVDAIQSQGVASCLKHFPGYGDAADTHTGFAQINKPLTKYEQEDLLPFKAGIEAGVDSIMVSHIVIKGLDPKLPASLSPVVHKLLRKKLNYQGLILTDDLQMGAITQYAKKHNTNADVLALKAGNDMLLGGTYQTGIPAIKKAIQTGQISTSQIDHSVRRILLLKEKLGILK